MLQAHPVPACAQAVPLKTGLTVLMEGSPLFSVITQTVKAEFEADISCPPTASVTVHSSSAVGTFYGEGGEVIPSALTRDLQGQEAQ